MSADIFDCHDLGSGGEGRDTTSYLSGIYQGCH